MKFDACILGPHGSAVYLHVMADDITHARALVRGEGLATFGRRGFSFTVREVS